MLSKEDRSLIKILRIEKGYRARRLVAEFPREKKNWFLASVRRLLHKIDTTGSARRKPAVVDVALRVLTRTLIASKIIWKNDWLKTGVALMRTLLTGAVDQWRDRIRIGVSVRKAGHWTSDLNSWIASTNMCLKAHSVRYLKFGIGLSVKTSRFLRNYNVAFRTNVVLCV